MEIDRQLHLYRLSTANASDSSTNLHRQVKSCYRLRPRWALKIGILVGHQSLLNRLSFLPSNLRTPFKIFNSLSSISTTEQKNCESLGTTTSPMRLRFPRKAINSSLKSRTFKKYSQCRLVDRRFGRVTNLWTPISTTSLETIRLL